ncbi:MAG: copper transport protein [Actinomycetota bacterium]|nr:copper transport protein [Actinomycetota bacterium]
MNFSSVTWRGNFPCPAPHYVRVRCDAVREAVSAVIDGEQPGVDLAAVLRHQATCPDCALWSRTWQREGARTRLVPVEPVPDLTDRIVAAVVADRAVDRRRRHMPTRVALVAVALAQLVATTPSLLLGQDQHASVHMARELGSFGVAISLGLLVAAAFPSLAAGSLPILVAAGGLLAVTAGLDIVSGRADAVAELPHLLPALGVLLLCRLVLTWSPPDPGEPPAGAPAVKTALHSWAHGLRLHGNRATVRLVHSLATVMVGTATCTFAVRAFVLSAIRVVRAVRDPRPGAPRVARPQPRRAGRRLVAATLLASGFGIVAAVPASAHATLESSSPPSGSVAASAPSTLSLHFDETVSVLPGSVKVVDPDGRRVDRGQIGHPAGRGADIAVGLRRGLPRGSYLVAWRVVSADSHPIRGAFTFSVGATSAAASVASLETSSSKPVGWLLGGGRFLTYAGLALLLGGAVFLLVCWPVGWQLRGARGALAAGWTAITVGTLVELGGKGPYDAGQGLASFGRPSLVGEVLATPYGAALGLRVLTLALVVGWWALGRRIGTRHPEWRTAGAALAVALLYSYAKGGHANAGSRRALALAVDATHLAAMATWLGGLAVLAFVLLRRVSVAHPDIAVAAPAAVTRFSRLAASSVAVLVATGTYQAWRQVGSVDALTATTYGRLLIVKLGLVVAVLAAAAVSRGWVRRRYHPVTVVHATVDSEVATAASPPPAAGSGLSVLRRSVATEAALAVVVLAVTAALVAIQPARSAYRPSVDENLRLGPVTMQVSAVPDGDRRMDLHLYAFDKTGAPMTPPEVTARVDLPARDLGPLPLVLHVGGPGHWLGSVSTPIRGDWRLQVSARTTDIDIYTADVTLPIR